MKKLRNIFLIFLLLIAVGITLLFVFISPIAKYEIEKNCIKWTGRKITIDSLNIHPFKSAVFIKNIKIYEADTNKVFFDCHDVYIKVSLFKILAGVYEINEIKIDAPEISVTQNGNKFNFDDLIKRFSSDTTKKPATKNTSETQYFLKKIIINNGNITYNNAPIRNTFRIHNINFNLPQLSWNDPESKVHLDFKYGTGGNFNIDLDANRKTFDYNLTLAIDSYDLSQYYAPLKAYIKVSSIKGSLTTHIRMHGRFNNPKEFSLVGFLHLNDVDVKDSANKKLFAMNELNISVDTINIKNNQFIFHDILMNEPYIVLNDYENGNNISRLIKHQEIKKEEEKKEEKKDTSKGKSKVDYTNIVTVLESSTKAMAIDFLSANYHVDSIGIRNGEFVFNDNTRANPFHYKVSKINIITDEIGPKNKSVIFNASALLNDTGKFAMSAKVNYDLRKKALTYKITTLNIKHISPIAKYLIEKYDTSMLGREVTIGHIKIDAMNGSIKIKDIKIYEYHSDKVFFDCHDFYVKLNMQKIFNGIYAIDTILIDQPEITISQDGNKFNFDDLKRRFSSKDTTKKTDTTGGPKIPYEVDNVIINNGNVSYTNIPINNTARVHNINLNIQEVRWDKTDAHAHLDFKYGTGGAFDIDADANLKTLTYNLSLAIDGYDLSQYYAPLQSFLSISSLNGLLSADLIISGKINSPKDISATGSVQVDDFEMKDSTKVKVFAMGELFVDIDTINVKQGIYSINNITMDEPYMRFDYYTNGNNISHMIKYTAPPQPVTDNVTGQVKPDYSNIFTMISSSIKLMAVDFFSTNYHTDSILIHNGQFEYNDYTLNRPFHYNITNISLLTDEISAKSKNIAFSSKATLNDTGKVVMNANLSIDMKDMLINYNITDLRLADLNPYFEYYMGTPFTDGWMNYQSTDSVINRNLKSTNLIHIEKLKAGKKLAEKSAYNMPMHTAVALLKDDKGNIDLNLPASGNLDDPNYKIGKVVWPMIGDLLKKTAESPVKLLAKLFSKNPEDLKELEFDYLQEKLVEKQMHKLEDVHKILKKKKELNVEITQIIDSLQEKDELALAMAKKRYFEETKHIVNDSLISRHKRKKALHASDKIDTQDTLFDRYLNDKLHLNGTELMTVEDKCIQLVGNDVLDKEVHRLIAKRNEQIADFLIKEKELEPERIKISTNRDSARTDSVEQPLFDIKYSADEKEEDK